MLFADARDAIGQALDMRDIKLVSRVVAEKNPQQPSIRRTVFDQQDFNRLLHSAWRWEWHGPLVNSIRQSQIQRNHREWRRIASRCDCNQDALRPENNRLTASCVAMLSNRFV